MTSLTAPQILLLLGWAQKDLPNNNLKVFTIAKAQPWSWAEHRVNRYLLTICRVKTLGSDNHEVMLGMRDEEVVQEKW